jgi:SAM-dependent methyltransferase
VRTHLRVPPATIDRPTRERAEISRSDVEAVETVAAGLAIAECQIARYMDPRPDTAFPLEYAFAVLGDVVGRTILELGCGSGINSVLLARRGARVIAVDISRSLIEVAARRVAVHGVGDRVRFVTGSAHDLPLAAESVDVVVGISVLHHLELDAAAREIGRVLKPGGRAIFKEPVRASSLLRLARPVVPYRRSDVSPFERPLTPADLETFRRRFVAGVCRSFWLPFVNVARVVTPQSRWFETAHRVDAAILRRWPVLTPLAGIRVFAVEKVSAVST